ncbi:RusA family crossover junction endodeoxyribonuclease [Pasteurella multocida]|uniref:RusA family crossover junction endodeoxyribonuclease n=1 Tax=Pasteurella multocida TaxID=747 RepID=UPI00287AA1F4|nr:RusA family crossover junction endodeoxyribonuclease [Pasteurella multocida]
MSDWLEIALPYPPSVNHYWKHTRCGRHYISKAGREFKRIATEVCKQFDPFDGSVEIKMQIYFPDNRDRDLDNLPKGIFDSLVGAGLIKDDNRKIIRKYSIEEMGVVKKGMSIIKIRSLE